LLILLADSDRGSKVYVGARGRNIDARDELLFIQRPRASLDPIPVSRPTGTGVIAASMRASRPGVSLVVVARFWQIPTSI